MNHDLRNAAHSATVAVVTPTTTVKLPPRFYDDHVDRDLPGGTVIRSTKGYRLVELTADEVAELRSDAAYYASQVGEFDPYLRGLCASARATIAALDAAPARAVGA